MNDKFNGTKLSGAYHIRKCHKADENLVECYHLNTFVLFFDKWEICTYLQFPDFFSA